MGVSIVRGVSPRLVGLGSRLSCLGTHITRLHGSPVVDAQYGSKKADSFDGRFWWNSHVWRANHHPLRQISLYPIMDTPLQACVDLANFRARKLQQHWIANGSWIPRWIPGGFGVWPRCCEKLLLSWDVPRISGRERCWQHAKSPMSQIAHARRESHSHVYKQRHTNSDTQAWFCCPTLHP